MSKFQFQNPKKAAMLGHIRVSNEAHAKLKEIAKEHNITVIDIVREFIEVSLKDYEKEKDADDLLEGPAMMNPYGPKA